MSKYKFLYSYSNVFLSPRLFRTGYIVDQILLDIPLPTLLFSPRHFAFHDLQEDKNEPIPPLRSLLGLGLNFCLHPRHQTRLDDTGLEKFKLDFCTRLMFAGKPADISDTPELYVRSNDWEPPAASDECML